MGHTKDIPLPKNASDLIRAAYARIQNETIAPWLEKPLYHRFLRCLTLNADTEWMNPYEVALREYAFEGKPLDGQLACVAMALSYWNSPLLRSNLSAMFIGGASVENAYAATNMDKQSLDAYKSLFCDTDVFGGSPLLAAEYVRQLPELSDEDKKEKTLYRMATEFGWEWVVWRITRGAKGHHAGARVVNTMVNLAFWRALEASSFPMDSEVAKEGRQYMKMSADLAINSQRAKMGEVTNIQDLALRLATVTEEEYQNERQGPQKPDFESILYDVDDDDD